MTVHFDSRLNCKMVDLVQFCLFGWGVFFDKFALVLGLDESNSREGKDRTT